MKFKKLRKIYRILFPLHLYDGQEFENRLHEHFLIQQFEKKDTFYEVSTVDGITLSMRGKDHSDFMVFNQIFRYHEYHSIIRTLLLNEGFSKNHVLIDAGANVGFTSLYFAHYLPNCSIYGIEPSADNFAVYSQNATYIQSEGTVKLYCNALAHESNMQFDVENDFRDKKDWALTTKASANGKVKGITVNELIAENNLSHISVLKIDIEGAERFIFQPDNDLSFLKITEIVAIEIHDEYDIRSTIYSILKEHNFFIIESGELTIGIKKSKLM